LNPTVADWDQDGIADIITNDINADIFLYKGTGNPLTLSEPVRFVYRDDRLPAAWRARPAVIDQSYNFGDTGRHCLLYLDAEGCLTVAVPQAAGSTVIEKIHRLKYVTGQPIKLDGPVGLWGRTKLAIADWDMDGRWDIVFGTNTATQKYLGVENFPDEATVFWLRNRGTDSEPVFDLPSMITLSDGTPIEVGRHNCSVWPTDMDGSGEPDLIVGAENGKIYYFRRSELAW
jgi:hypothetical protein